MCVREGERQERESISLIKKRVECPISFRDYRISRYFGKNDSPYLVGGLLIFFLFFLQEEKRTKINK